MRKIVLFPLLIGVFVGSLANCGIGVREEPISSNSVFAQTNSVLQETKDKQNNKLYPYYLDLPVELSLDGAKLNLILVAVEEFRKDKEIPKEKKDFSKYNIELRQDENFFFVIMNVKRNPEKDYAGGETEDGIDVTYFISKKDRNVKRVFHK